MLENGSLRMLRFEGGYVDFSGSEPRYCWYSKDHLGSVRAVADEDGNVIASYAYDPYGAEFSSSGEPFQPYKFSGKEHMSSVGLDMYDFGARMYSSSKGCWMSMDPLCEKYYHINPYVYCAGNPVNLNDPNGMAWFQHIASGSYVWYDERPSEENVGDGCCPDDENYRYVGDRGCFGEWESVVYNLYRGREGFGDAGIYTNGFTFSIVPVDYTRFMDKEFEEEKDLSGVVLFLASTAAGGVGTAAERSKVSFRIVNSKGLLDFHVYHTALKKKKAVNTISVAKLGKTMKYVGMATGVASVAIPLAQLKYATTVEAKSEAAFDAFMGAIGFIPGAGTVLSAYWTFGGRDACLNYKIPDVHKTEWWLLPD